MRESMFYKKKGETVICGICPNNCEIKNNKLGKCLGRKNQDGRLYAQNYGNVTGLHIDPIEKKPLYHYNPGAKILSLGTYGCNLKCDYCQNHNISQNIVEVFLVNICMFW